MTEDNLALRSHTRWAPFWRDLKRGYDAFEDTQLPPRISVCQGRYIVTGAGDERSNASHEIDTHCHSGAAKS